MGFRTPMRGIGKNGLEVEHDARPIAGEAERVDGGAEMRSLVCHQSRMFRSLHRRWPYRRSHCRHHLHWLVRVQSHACASSRDRTHSLTGLRARNRRPHQG
jgi:hypothetical protein